MAELEWTELPEPVRVRLAELAAAAVGELPQNDVPVSLRRLARFTPSKRARLGARPLIAQLRESSAFRAAVLAWWTGRDLDQPAEGAGVPDSADPAVAAAHAVLADAPDAGALLAQVAERTDLATLRVQRDTALAKVDKLTAESERLRAELAEAKAAIRAARAERGEELDRLRRRFREQGMRVREARDAAAQARHEARLAVEQSDQRVAEALAERDRAAQRAEADRTRAARLADRADDARRAAEDARRADAVRIEMLLDTLAGALDGLRGELGVDRRGRTGGTRPADLVEGAARPATLATRVPDATVLGRLLALPSAHLIVDGYNVSKTEYADLALFDQRSRLTAALAALVARTGAEITVVFDGATLAAPSLTRHPRGVRVLFSRQDVQADDVIRELVGAEPAGRVLVVASSDRAVADSVRQGGAHPVASSVLLELLRRS